MIDRPESSLGELGHVRAVCCPDSATLPASVGVVNAAVQAAGIASLLGEPGGSSETESWSPYETEEMVGEATVAQRRLLIGGFENESGLGHRKDSGKKKKQQTLRTRLRGATRVS